MSKITIVTAYYDVGRSEWTQDKGFPSYLQRDNDAYLNNFKIMCELENDIILYTSSDLAPGIRSAVEDLPANVTVVEYDLFSEFRKLNNKIKAIQHSPRYRSWVSPHQIHNPEYWCSEYVLINIMKIMFMNKAIEAGLVQTDLVSWVDYGYCRSKDVLCGAKSWGGDIDKDKVYLVSIKDIKPAPNIVENAIINNDVSITGGTILTSKNLCPKLLEQFNTSLDSMLEANVIDDDQSILLLTYLRNPSMFEIIKADNTNWFVIFDRIKDHTL